jgi:hypothetical protein
MVAEAILKLFIFILKKKKVKAQKVTEDSPLIKSCYAHLGGKFGNRLAIRFEELGWIEKDPESKHYLITKKGKREFEKLGVSTDDLLP